MKSKDLKNDPIVGLAKDLIKSKITGYVENINIANDLIKKAQGIDEIVELTKELIPDGYQEVLDKFYEKENKNEMVDHPNHYGGESNPYEVIKVIEAWDLNFNLGNAIKYIGRSGKKDPQKEKEDLLKAIWYLERHIRSLEKNKEKK